MLYKSLMEREKKERVIKITAVDLCFFSFLLLLTFLATTTLSHAETKSLSAAILEESTEQLPLAPYSLLQKDPEGKVTPESIQKTGGMILKGQMVKGSMIDLGHDGISSWISVRIRNNSSQKNWILNPIEISDGKLGYIQSKKVYEMNLSQTAESSSIITLKEIIAGDKSGGYKIKIEKDEEKLILVNVTGSAGKPAVFSLTMYSDGMFSHVIREKSSTNFIVFQTLFLFFAMSFLGSIFKKDRNQLLYGAYFIFMAFFWMFPEYLPPSKNPELFGTVLALSILGFSVLSLYMTKTFMSSSIEDREKNILYASIALNVLTTILVFVVPDAAHSLLAVLLYAPPVLSLAIMFYFSLSRVKTEETSAALYFLSCAFPMLGFLTTIFSSFGIFPQASFLLNAFWYTLIPQGIFLTSTAFKEIFSGENSERLKTVKTVEPLNLTQLKETRDNADHLRLLKVIEQERAVLSELREKEAVRVGEMMKAKEMADEANRAKSAFLAMVSHEIRTPMTGIMGMAKLLLESNISKQQRDYAFTIQESSESMMALLNDILDFEKIQRGKIELENISFDLHRLINGVVTLMSGHAAEKKIALSARIDENLPKFVKGDPTRLRQVLLNLMGNAIKFTQQGHVTLMVKNLNHTDTKSFENKNEKHMIYFAIQDTGIGISPEAQKNLFNPFSQANSSISRKFGGSGLGLAISKGLIENMKSSINLNSMEGEGSTFFFTLEMEKGLPSLNEPAQPLNNHPVLQAEKPALPLKILVVDDNTIIRKVVVTLLKDDHHDVVTSTSAEDALDKINKDAFDLILMDIELPGMHGNDATRILRDHKDPVKSALPVFAMTGNIGKEDMQRYLADGMTGILTKPVDSQKLKSIVNDIARKTFEREIKMPNDPFLQTSDLDDGFSQEKFQKKAVVKEGEIFNPDMLQSLKDTIGTTQLNGLLEDLMIKTDEILQQMIDASEAGDMKSLAARAHELKGMAGNFGLTEISAIAEKAEKKAKLEETDGLKDLVKTLPEASTRAQSTLKDWMA